MPAKQDTNPHNNGQVECKDLTCKVVTLEWAFGSNLHDLEKLCENSYEKL